MGSFERGEKEIMLAVGLQNRNDLEKIGGEMSERERRGNTTESMWGSGEKWVECRPPNLKTKVASIT